LVFFDGVRDREFVHSFEIESEAALEAIRDKIIHAVEGVLDGIKYKENAARLKYGGDDGLAVKK
jgi:hypothetical protein